MQSILISHSALDRASISAVAFRRHDFEISFDKDTLARIDTSYEQLSQLLERRVPVYGVSTGFGDSCHRAIEIEQMMELQRNLISYLSCGTGPSLSREVARALTLFRLKSLSRGYSGVSRELVERLKLYLENDWVPVVPREGSLGASGDLIPLAYLARVLQGEGEVYTDSGVTPIRQLLKEAGIKPYELKPKEGLALVNGTSAMTAAAYISLRQAEGILETAEMASAWTLFALNGKVEAFGELINERAKLHAGQAACAAAIRKAISAQGYLSRKVEDIKIDGSHTEELIQDRYSLRCVPQILGPVRDTISLVGRWLDDEINSTSDNPVVGERGELAMGGNFYGGYVSQGMDYTKIALAHVADLADRQLAFVVDDKSNRGLPPNLAAWSTLPKSDRHLHHGLKGLHQAVGAITSEVMAKAIPNGIFSRSSESHNQDKVSLGMSAAVQCGDMIEQIWRIQSLQLTCLAQALDLRGVALKENAGLQVYEMVRRHIPFVEKDSSMGDGITALSQALKSSWLR